VCGMCWYVLLCVRGVECGTNKKTEMERKRTSEEGVGDEATRVHWLGEVV